VRPFLKNVTKAKSLREWLKWWSKHKTLSLNPSTPTPKKVWAFKNCEKEKEGYERVVGVNSIKVYYTHV
jgi:hypothetical protein